MNPAHFHPISERNTDRASPALEAYWNRQQSLAIAARRPPRTCSSVIILPHLPCPGRNFGEMDGAHAPFTSFIPSITDVLWRYILNTDVPIRFFLLHLLPLAPKRKKKNTHIRTACAVMNPRPEHQIQETETSTAS